MSHQATQPQEQTLSDQELIDAFVGQTLKGSQVNHVDHIRLVWADLQRRPLLSALQRQVDGLRRLTERLGDQEKYHETITWGFVLLIHDRLERGGRDLSWEDFQQQNPDLMTYHPSPLAPYYTEKTLHSELARRVFVLPDRLGFSN